MSTFLLIFAAAAVALAVWTQVEAGRAAIAHPPSGVFVPIAGGRIHLEDHGPKDAPPERTIVLIHGASCNLKALTLPLLEPLRATGFRVIAIDRPGHGWSDRPGGRASATPTRQAALIAEALRAHGVPRAIILGHSLAGAVATTFALNHGAQAAGLVLLSPVTHPWPGGITWYYTVGNIPIVGAIFAHLLPVPGAALTMQSGIDSVFRPQSAPENYAEATALSLLLRPANFVANAEDVAHLADHVAAHVHRYPEISASTVVISGDVDTVVSTQIHTQALSKQLRDVRSVILENVGHTPHHAQTSRVVEEIVSLSARIMPQAQP